MKIQDAEHLCISRGTGIFNANKTTHLYLLAQGQITRFGPLHPDSIMYYENEKREIESTRLQPGTKYLSPYRAFRRVFKDVNGTMTRNEVEAQMAEVEIGYRAHFKCDVDDVLHVSHGSEIWSCYPDGDTIIFVCWVLAAREVQPWRRS